MTNSVFSDVAASSDKVVSLMGEISAASQEQSQGIAQVNSAIAEINATTQQNAANAENLSAVMSIFRANIEDDEGEPAAAAAKAVSKRRQPALVGYSRERAAAGV